MDDLSQRLRKAVDAGSPGEGPDLKWVLSEAEGSD